MDRSRNTAAQDVVLSGIIKFGNKVYQEVAEILNEECFTESNSLMTYQTCKKILESSDYIDLPSFKAMANSCGFGNEIDFKYVNNLFINDVDINSVKNNAKIIRKQLVIRSLKGVTKQIHRELDLMTGEEPLSQISMVAEDPILNFNYGQESEEKIVKLSSKSADIVKMLSELDGKSLGIPTRCPEFNNATGGRNLGYTSLMVARSKNGKSQFCVDDALFVTEKLKIPVLYLDSEMSELDTTVRILSNLSDLPFTLLKNGEFEKNSFYRNKVYEAQKRFEQNELLSYVKIAGMPFPEILQICRKWIMKNVGLSGGQASQPSLIQLDYMKLMEASDLKEYEALGYNMSSLSDFCQKYNTHAFVLAQQNREGADVDSSKTISGSDRLLWLTSSFCILRRKTYEEMMVDGAQNGSAKLIVSYEQRFGPGLNSNDHINLQIDYDRCKVREIGLKSQMKKNQNSGFETTDEFTDEDFDQADYRDKEYRTSSS